MATALDRRQRREALNRGSERVCQPTSRRTAALCTSTINATRQPEWKTHGCSCNTLDETLDTRGPNRATSEYFVAVVDGRRQHVVSERRVLQASRCIKARIQAHRLSGNASPIKPTSQLAGPLMKARLRGSILLRIAASSHCGRSTRRWRGRSAKNPVSCRC